MQSPISLPHVPLPKSPTWLNEFKAFIMRGSVVDLAVGVIIGAATLRLWRMAPKNAR